jgi:hypothetical protein
MNSHQLWKATLNSSSPRYREWRKIFNSDDIPLIGPGTFSAKLGTETDFVHLLDWHQIVGEESDRMLEYFSKKFKTPIDQVEKEFDETGHVPIRASDVVVSYSLRAFL